MLQFHLKNSKGGTVMVCTSLTDENLHPSCCCSRDNEDLWESHKTQRLHLELEKKKKHECGHVKKLQTAAYLLRAFKVVFLQKLLSSHHRSQNFKQM